jgi:hypothetical protein
VESERKRNAEDFLLLFITQFQVLRLQVLLPGIRLKGMRTTYNILKMPDWITYVTRYVIVRYNIYIYELQYLATDRLCGLVVRVPGYRSRGPGFDFRRYQIFWEIVGLERGTLSLVRIIEELLERKVAAPVYKTEINDRGDSLRWPRDTLYPLKLALTSPASGGRSIGIVRWRTKPRSYFNT